MSDCASTLNASWYRFAGTFVTSRLAGVAVGDVFHGSLRYGPRSLLLEAHPPEARYADPEGVLDATVAGRRVRSAGAVELRLFSTRRVSQVALAATPAGGAGRQFRACHVTLLTARPIELAAALAAALDEDAFDTRSFTLEDASYTGFAIGEIQALSRVARRAA